MTNKILNDPLYGFIRLESKLILRLVDHPLFQRLRYIRQLGMTYLVYPGATHSRMAHALGAMHLMQEALDILAHKGYHLSPDDRQACLIAILLHDLGHAPFSHALEGFLIQGMPHEEISLLMMEDLNRWTDGALETTLDVFRGTHEIPFLHELVSSQLDMDRLDYLNRDSFFTGVTEGIIGVDRILQMLDVHQGRLVVERKGIYSIEKYLMSRYLMYWQVYLHKTVLSAEYLLGHILNRARQVLSQGLDLFVSPDLGVFLRQAVLAEDFRRSPEIRDAYARLDDSEIMVHLKAWSRRSEPVLEHLSQQLMRRQLSAVVWSSEPVTPDTVHQIALQEAQRLGLGPESHPYLAHCRSVRKSVYSGNASPIFIKDREGTIHALDALQDHIQVVDLHGQHERFALYRPKLRP
ncbi:MAG: HD domain-containing protein [Bacteroidota bacterium]